MDEVDAPKPSKYGRLRCLVHAPPDMRAPCLVTGHQSDTRHPQQHPLGYPGIPGITWDNPPAAAIAEADHEATEETDRQP